MIMANLVRKQTVVAAKIETTAGTAIALAGADAAFNAFDAEITPEIELVERPGQSAFSRLVAVPAGRLGTLPSKPNSVRLQLGPILLCPPSVFLTPRLTTRGHPKHRPPTTRL